MDYLPLLKKYDNLVIGRTLSKVYGLAGLRVGYGFVPAWLEGPYRSAATPFTLNRVSEAAAVAAVSDTAYRDNFIAHVRKWRETFVREIPFPVLARTSLPMCGSGVRRLSVRFRSRFLRAVQTSCCLMLLR